MKSYFKLEEFYKPGVIPSDGIIVKIYHHIDVLNAIRKKLGVPIIISSRSGYRPVEYELAQGRSGTSEHTFKGRGAVDLTCQADKMGELLRLLLDSSYTRVCYYPNKHFIHCDFKSQEKRTYICTNGTTWIRHKFT